MLLNPALVGFGRAHAIGTLATVPLPGTPSTAGTAVAAKAVSYVCVTEDGYDHAAVLGRLRRSTPSNARAPSDAHARMGSPEAVFREYPNFSFGFARACLVIRSESG